MLVWSGRSLDFKDEEYVASYPRSGQDPASSLNRHAFLVLVFQSIENADQREEESSKET